ncbi:MAG: peptidylprolyl isomerase [Prolixibacteraceae bacterium]|jgi:peptidyl-prolyl cis-trans isomerase A (cyclophilin A)|nr:peptidylprolyl isomerase [Prolixibacteraceae bacterium]
MKKTQYLIWIVVVLMLAISCTNKAVSDKQKQNKQEETASKPKSVFTNLPNSIFEIKTYDDERILETGKCFLITQSTLLAPFELFKNGANKAVITPLNGGKSIELTSYYAFDRINNLMLLHVDFVDAKPLKLYGASKKIGLKTTVIGKKMNNTQPLYTGSCLQEQIIEGRKLLSISNKIGKRNIGMPIFVSNGSVLGMGIIEEVMYEKKYFAVSVADILELLNRKGDLKQLATIGSPNEKKNASIKGITLLTDFGDIQIRLYNETPAYRDNFIQLAEEGFYDSLLIHRVIRNFGIQTGAADTRHAKSDDIVGWKGPGYNIPAHIIPELYHKRGAIGSPRKPDDKNKQRRSDGSQFYIVTGRKYLDNELDEFEEENNIKFTSEQREYYKKVGGSPHLDGSYTVFGEVVSGLDVADRISMLPVKGDFRPITNIRLKKVVINYLK